MSDFNPESSVSPSPWGKQGGKPESRPIIPQTARRRGGWLSGIWRVVSGFLAVIGFVTVMSVWGLVSLVGHFGEMVQSKSGSKDFVEQGSTLDVVMDGPFIEGNLVNPFEQILGNHALTLGDVTRRIRLAAQDSRIKDLRLQFVGNGPGMTQVQEISAALQHFRASGKKITAVADSYGELTPDGGAYLLAAQADTIQIGVLGTIGFNPPSADIPFFGGALQKLGVDFEVYRRSGFKTALEQFTETGLTANNRLMLQSLFDDLLNQQVTAIAKARKMPEDKVRAAILSAPLTAQQARELGFVDRIAPMPETLYGSTEIESYPMENNALYAGKLSDKVIGVVHVNGEIIRGRAEPGIFADTSKAVSQEIVAAVRQAMRESDAVILRINSPGGSAVASGTIADALAEVKQRKKPLIVSMGEMAASGGYWIAAPGDVIFANPATLTGSIGVLGGKPSVAGISDKIGVKIDPINVGGTSGMWSVSQPFNLTEAQRFDGLIGGMYDQFKQHVAVSRKLPPEFVEEQAQGRVWSGQQALDRKLVDRLGGLDDAIAYAEAQLKIPAGQIAQIQVFPKAETLLEELQGLLSMNGAQILAMLGIGVTSAPIQVKSPYVEQITP